MKKHIIIISVLCVIALAVGYWSSLEKQGVASRGDANSIEEKEPDFLQEGLVVYYPFNGNVKDESGNGYDGKVNGAGVIVDGKAKFNGVDQYVVAECQSLPQGKASRTLSFWAQAERHKALTENIVSWGEFSKGKSFGAYVGKNKFAFLGVGSPGADFWVGPSDADMHHHCINYDGKKMVTYYIDGQEKASVYREQLNTSGKTVFMGAQVNLAEDRFFKGSIDDVRIYNRALSKEQVKALYEWEKPKAE